MKISKHAEFRCNQRGISSWQLKLLMTFGTPVTLPGNAIGYQLTKSNVKELEAALKKGVQLLDKLKNKRIICDESSDNVITCYSIN